MLLVWFLSPNWILINKIGLNYWLINISKEKTVFHLLKETLELRKENVKWALDVVPNLTNFDCFEKISLYSDLMPHTHVVLSCVVRFLFAEEAK